MFDEWQQATNDEAADLDLIPVMNLFMVLIPFLLLGAAFVHMSVIPTSTPTRGRSKTSKKQKKKKEPTSVMAQLVLKPETMKLTFSGSGISQKKLDSLAAEWSLEGDGYPLDSLRAELLDAKEKYPESNTITVVPHSDFSYQELVNILDAARERKREAPKKKKGKAEPKPLFPVTVFSKFPPPAQSEDQGSSKEQ